MKTFLTQICSTKKGVYSSYTLTGGPSRIAIRSYGLVVADAETGELIEYLATHDQRRGRIMRMTKRIANAFAAIGIAAVLSVVPTATPAQAATYQGCPDGYVCIYPNASWNGGRPSLKYYYYGTYNLSNQFGVKRVLNAQTGGAIARFCTGYNGVNCGNTLPAGYYFDIDFTPINSIVLSP
jgi:hypothetical protein